MASIAAYLLRHRPTLKGDLRRARMAIDPEQFVARSLRLAIMIGFAAAALVFFFLSKSGVSPLLVIGAGLLGGFAGYWYLMKTPLLRAAKIATDIDREVLFAGRFLMIKLNSGTPLVNAIFEASKSKGVAGTYFAEIVRDIELGTPLEEAIERAMQNSPSKHWRRVLFQIHNALKLGIDVTNSLESVLQDISNDYLLQIQRYGKKLSTMTLFYLLVAVVFPSLGMTIMTVLVSIAGIPLTGGFFLVILVFLTFVQIIFMQLFTSIRPKVAL